MKIEMNRARGLLEAARAVYAKIGMTPDLLAAVADEIELMEDLASRGATQLQRQDWFDHATGEWRSTTMDPRMALVARSMVAFFEGLRILRDAPTPEPRPEPYGPRAVEVESVAILLEGGELFSLPRPARHEDLVRALVARGVAPPIPGRRGFVLTDGTFVDPERAMVVALARRQILRASSTLKRRLDSCDVW